MALDVSTALGLVDSGLYIELGLQHVVLTFMFFAGVPLAPALAAVYLRVVSSVPQIGSSVRSHIYLLWTCGCRTTRLVWGFTPLLLCHRPSVLACLGLACNLMVEGSVLDRAWFRLESSNL